MEFKIVDCKNMQNAVQKCHNFSQDRKFPRMWDFQWCLMRRSEVLAKVVLCGFNMIQFHSQKVF